jgi:hypothetical protein
MEGLSIKPRHCPYRYPDGRRKEEQDHRRHEAAEQACALPIVTGRRYWSIPSTKSYRI